MSHMVMFRNAEGKPGYHQAGSLDEAIAFVEGLPDQEQVPDARIFRMEEVPIKVKTFYKIEVSTSGAPPAAAASPAPPVSPPSPPPLAPTAVPAAAPPASGKGNGRVEEVVVVEPAGGPGGARFGRFNRS